MQIWIDTAVEIAPSASTTPPVDELLRVYLGQSRGSRAPEPEVESPVARAQDLWDHLGDFA
jgi:hypothetical protein